MERQFFCEKCGREKSFRLLGWSLQQGKRQESWYCFTACHSVKEVTHALEVQQRALGPDEVGGHGQA